MFAKPYKLKSNNALKNTEKKQLTQRVLDEFPLATEEKAKEIVPPKENCNCMKLVLHTGDVVSVYSVEGIPMLIETLDGLVPTVCALWKVPDLLPTLTIHSPVLSKVQNGAPLYLPGVVLPAAGMGFPLFQIGALLGVRTEDNGAAALVGRAAMSSADMLLRASGVCLDTIHVYGDALCSGPKFNKIVRPKIAVPKSTGIPINLSTNLRQIALQPVKEEWPSLGPPPSARPAPPAPPAPLECPERRPHEPALIPVDTPPTDDTENNDISVSEPGEAEDEIPSDMDGLLRWCLLCFIKLDGKSVELPLKTNLLYKNHMLPLCPPDKTLDVKKSSYKKLSKFLEAMQQEGLLETRELERGVAAVVALRPAHPAVRGVRRATRPPRAADAPPAYEPPAVRDVYCVTAHVLPLLSPLKKGTPLAAGEVRARLAEYVRARGLAGAQGTVLLDSLLAKVLNKPEQECVRWEALMSGVTSRMTAGAELRGAGGGAVQLARSRLEPIKMLVQMRSGNKKVTLVSNLEQFGLSPAALASECQRGTAASCGVTRSPGSKADQLMLQGDQTHFMAKLLIEKYQLPKKFVEGADKALNKKK